MSVDRPRTGAAPTTTRRGRAAATCFDSRPDALRPGLDSRAAAGCDSRAPAPASRSGEPEAVDPAATVELSPEMVAALIAESAGAGAAEPAPAAADPWSLPTRPRRIATATAPGPITAAATAIWRSDRPHRAPPPRCHHRGLLAIALLWGVLATGLLIVAFYVLSVVARAGAHGP